MLKQNSKKKRENPVFEWWQSHRSNNWSHWCDARGTVSACGERSVQTPKRKHHRPKETHKSMRQKPEHKSRYSCLLRLSLLNGLPVERVSQTIEIHECTVHGAKSFESSGPQWCLNGACGRHVCLAQSWVTLLFFFPVPQRYTRMKKEREGESEIL